MVRLVLAVATLILLAMNTSAAQDHVSSTLRGKLQARAGQYPLRDVRLFGSDSALLVFDDSTYTGAADNNGQWMFGPPVTAAEADSCPPEKVLGRKLARLLWRELGKPSTFSQVTVRVRGTIGVDRLSYKDMYYYRRELETPWAGDRDGQ